MCVTMKSVWYLSVLCLAMFLGINSLSWRQVRTCRAESLDEQNNPLSETSEKGMLCSDQNEQKRWRMTFIRVLQTLIDDFRWRHVWIFLDSSDDDAMAFLLDGLASSGTVVSTYDVTHDTKSTSIHNYLLQLYHQTADRDRNMLILCQNPCLAKIIQEMNKFDVTNRNETALWKYSRLLLLLDNIEDMPTSVYIDNVAVVTRELNNHTKVESVPKMDLHALLYREDGRALSYVDTVRVDGCWPLRAEVFPNRNFGLNRRKLTVGTLPWFPFVMGSPETGYEGLCIDLLDRLAHMLNFTYEITLPKDGEWGAAVNGSWTGLVRELMTREMDLVMAILTVNREREAVIDFSFPFYYDRGVGIFRKPSDSQSRWLQLLKPFKYNVYLCMGVGVIGTTIFLVIIEESIWNEKRNLGRRNMKQRMENLSDILIYVFGSVLLRVGDSLKLTDSGRMFVSFWWMFCIILAAIYCGNLVAFLAVVKQQLPFETLEEIAAQTVYKWGTTGGTSWQTYFQSSNTKTNRDLWVKMEEFSSRDPDILSRSLETHRQKVLSGSYVFFGNKDTLSTWTVHECGLELTKETFHPEYYGVGLPHNSPLYGDISRAILQIEQDGLLTKWKNRWWPEESLACETGRGASSVPLETLQGALVLSACGIVLSLFVLFIEWISARRDDILKKLLQQW